MTENAAVNAISLNLPRFTISNPRAWFYAAEANFHIKGVKDTSTKASYVIAALPEEALNELWTWLEQQSSRPKYEDLKTELIRLFSPAITERGKAILEMPSIGLGDRNPRQLGQYLDRLALLPDGKEVDLYKEVFLQSMPGVVRGQVKDDNLSRQELYEECHRIFLATRAKAAPSQQLIAPCHHSESPTTAVSAGDCSVDAAQSQPLREFRNKTQWVKPRRSNFLNKTHQPEVMKLNSQGVCSFHERYGKNSRSCMAGCTFSKN